MGSNFGIAEELGKREVAAQNLQIDEEREASVY